MLIGYFLVETNLIENLRNIKVIAWTTLIFGILLHISDKYNIDKNKEKDFNFKSAIFIGFFQIISLIPGASRSGITLTAANTVIYYSNGYDLEKRLQSEDRAHRIGQKKAVTYIDLIAPKTVDEKIRKALRKKINIATQIMGEELREWI